MVRGRRLSGEQGWIVSNFAELLIDVPKPCLSNSYAALPGVLAAATLMGYLFLLRRGKQRDDVSRLITVQPARTGRGRVRTFMHFI
jgi:hypothetical protein